MFWGLLPSQVLDLSMGEVEKLLKVGTEKHKSETRKHAALLATIMNAPFMYKKDDDTLWTAEDMISDPEGEPEDIELYNIAQARLSEAKAQRMGL